MRRDAEVIRQIFAGHDPARDVVSGNQFAQAAADLITSVPLPHATDQRRISGTSSRRHLLSAGVAVAAAAAVAIAGLAVLRGRAEPASPGQEATPALLAFQTGGPMTSAREALLKAAASAGRQPDNIGTGKYLYVETQGWYLNTRVSGKVVRSAVIPVRRRQWIAADGSGRIDSAPLPPYFPSARDREAWLADGQPSPQASTDNFGPGGLGLMWPPDSLSADQATLTKQLEQGHPVDLGPAETLVAVSDLYNEQPVPPAIRAALLRIVANLPGLSYDGMTTDRAGRKGIGVSLVSALGLPTRYIMIFDPVTGQLLDSEQVLTTSAGQLNVPIPAVISYTVYLRSDRTSHLAPPK